MRTPHDPRSPRGPLPSRYELAIETPLRRALTSVNLRPEDKAVFDALQAFYSLRQGRALRQWEVFSLVLAEALASQEAELRAAGFRVAS